MWPVLLQCRGDVTKTYNLEAYDNWFNCLSMLVATEICRVGIHRKQDVKGILALRAKAGHGLREIQTLAAQSKITALLKH